MVKARRAKGEGAIYQRGDGRWVAQIEAGRDERGRRRYVRRVRRTQTEALAVLRELQRDVDAGVVPDATTTVAAYLGWWLDSVLYDRAPATVQTYRSIIGRWIVPLVGSVRLHQLTPGHVQKMMADLDRQGLSPWSRQAARKVLVSALRWAERDGMVRRNAAQLVDGPRLAARIDDALTADEARAVLAAARGHRLEAAAVLALRLGLRIGEIAALRWVDVDFEAGTVTVARGKTRAAARTLPLVGSFEVLQARRVQQKAERLAAGPMWQDAGHVLSREDGSPLSTDAIRCWWHEMCEAAGVERRRFHATRHTAATLLLEDGVPLEVVSAVLGHAGLAITADVYARVGADAKRRALGRLDSFLG